MAVSFDVMRDGNARRLFLGQLISQTCDKMMSVGLVWLFTAHYPAVAIPCFLGVSALPHLLLSWAAGPWSARVGIVRMLITTDLFRGAVFVLLALAWPAVGPDSQLVVLFTASFISNMASALFNPAMFSSPVALVEESLVQKLTALVESCFNVGNVVGPLLTAVLYPWLGLRGLFLLNGASYILAAGVETGLRERRNPDAHADAAPPATTREVLRADPLVTAMLGGFLANNLFLNPLMVLLPLFVHAIYHGTLSTLATLETLFGVGTIVGGLALSAIHLETRLGRKIAAGMGGVAVAYGVFTLSTASPVGYVCLATLGFFLSTTNVFSMTIFQTRLPARDVPTLMGLVNLISVASLPISMAVVGVALGYCGVRALALVSSAGLALATLAVVARRDLRAL